RRHQEAFPQIADQRSMSIRVISGRIFRLRAIPALYPNHPLLYATHQHPTSSGSVSARLHQIGSVKSMGTLRTMNSIQKILRSIRKTSPLMNTDNTDRNSCDRARSPEPRVIAFIEYFQSQCKSVSSVQISGEFSDHGDDGDLAGSRRFFAP